MKALIRHDQDGNDVKIEELPIPKPGNGEVLIRVEASPINPSDAMHCKGKYGLKHKLHPIPIGIGFEGSGQIVELGADVPESYMNKKVAFYQDVYSPKFQGTWIQYVVMSAVPQQFIVFNDDVDYTKIAAAYINPLTAIQMLDIAKKHEQSIVVQSAAASTLGKMVIKLFRQHNIDVINLIRRDEQIEVLEKLGAKHIFNTEKPAFNENFRKVCDELKPRVFFDAVAGELPAKIIPLLPEGTTTYIYGGISGAPVSKIPVDQLIFHLKDIRGFWVAPWLQELPAPERAKAFEEVIKDLSGDGTLFKSKTVSEYKLEEWQQAIEESQKVASEGKVLIRPNKE